MRARLRRPVLILVLIAIALLGAGVLVVRSLRATGDPSATEVKDAITSVAPQACRGHVSIRGIENMGGPGLPSGMRKAREIVCDADVARAQPEEEFGHPRLAIHYVFASGAAARRWLAFNDDRLGDPLYGWWLHGETLIGGVDVTGAKWRQVLGSLK